jgi:hypothetical protein
MADIASQDKRRRKFGFWCSLLSNFLWLVWGWHAHAHAHAHALVVLQIALAFLNIRGASKNEPELNVKSEA